MHLPGIGFSSKSDSKALKVKIDFKKLFIKKGKFLFFYLGTFQSFYPGRGPRKYKHLVGTLTASFLQIQYICWRL
jgi:hypothetical protein